MRSVTFSLALALAVLAFAPDASAQLRYEGSLGSGDDTLQSGEYTQAYTFEAQEGDWVEVLMTSTDLDPYLIVKPPSCTGSVCEEQFDNDDFHGDGRAYVGVSAPESGTYEVLATTYAPGETGSFTVEILSGNDAPDLAGGWISNMTSWTEQDRLAQGDKQLNSGEYVDRFGFVGRAGDSVVIDLTSDEFDPYLILFMPGDDQIDNDDWEGSQQQSRIEATLPADGVYSIAVTSYEPGEEGGYLLQIGGSGPALERSDDGK